MRDVSMELGTFTWWEKLVNDINTEAGYHVLEVGFRAKSDHTDPSLYLRSEIKKVVHHEGLFNIQLRWQSVFHRKKKCWLWRFSPNSNDVPVNSIEGDTTVKGSNFPLYRNTSYGRIIQISDDILVNVEHIKHYHLNPLNDGKLIDYKKSDWTSGGLFILPPNYSDKLYISQIRFAR